MSSARSNAMHAVSSSVADLYGLKSLTVPERRKKVASLLKNDSFTCPDGYRSVSHLLLVVLDTTLIILSSSRRSSDLQRNSSLR